MVKSKLASAVALSGLLVMASGIAVPNVILAQEQTASAAPAAPEATAPDPLSAEELEILAARIALYPDDLVAVIASASLYPIQIVQAGRFLEDLKTKKDLKPQADWDGSVVSLLNYPDIVKMMSDDLDWTEAMGEAISYQQNDVLAAIQQLREKAVAEGIIKTDDKVKVVEENDNIIIQPASAEVVYVPQYAPEMLYEPGYAYQPVSYYPEPYPYYYSPAAPFFAGLVTGAIWGGIVDWDDGFWGGNWGGNDIDIDCNQCFNNVDFDGKFNMNNADWKNVDRSKIKFDKNQFNNLDKSKFKNNIKANDRNKITNKAGDLKKNRSSTMPGKSGKVKDVRASTLEGLKKQPGNKLDKAGQGSGPKATKPGQGAGNKKPSGGKIDRPVGKPKPAARADNRPKNASPLGEVNKGRTAKKQSSRGSQSMGGGMKSPNVGNRGGGSHKQFKRPPPRSGGGGGGRGGGGRGRR